MIIHEAITIKTEYSITNLDLRKAVIQNFNSKSEFIG